MIKAIDTLGAEALTGKTLLMRVDFNCPLQKGKVADATRIDRIMPGIMALLDKGAGIILLSHLGRPKGRVVPEMSLAPVAAYIEEHYDASLPLIADLDGLSQPGAGQMILLENLRFWP
ncbi:MAG: phosphoglycerate kinase, partial [Candidatus Puniceispirillaceae bacterium]